MSDPRTPADVPVMVHLGALADELAAHTMALVDHRHGLVPLTGERYVAHNLAALAYCTALGDRLLGGRWVHAREALAAGATVGQVAAAMGMEPDELCAGLVEWAEGQCWHGLITHADHAEVLALVDVPDETER